MTAAGPLRLRLALTQPQATDQTTVLEWLEAAFRDTVAFARARLDRDRLERERRAHLGQVASRVHVLEGADHSFRVRGRGQAQVLDEVAGVVAGWLEELA